VINTNYMWAQGKAARVTQRLYSTDGSPPERNDKA